MRLAWKATAMAANSPDLGRVGASAEVWSAFVKTLPTTCWHEPCSLAERADKNGSPNRHSRQAMKRTSPLPKAKSQSIWAATVKMPVCRRLSQDLETDVCIVGA